MDPPMNICQNALLMLGILFYGSIIALGQAAKKVGAFLRGKPKL
jgi:hypothetical protein